MKSLFIVLLIAVLAIMACGQTKSADDKSKAPAMPADVESEYYRTDAAVAHMQTAWDAAQADLQKAVVALQKACGDKFVPFSSGKHIVCTAKPEQGAAPATAPK